jgi:hypothetical protein
MTGRKAIFSLWMLCAMVLSAISAQGASAGQTAFTCVAGTGFSTEHCVPGQTGTSFGHVAITETTHAKFSNEKTNATTTGPTDWTLRITIAATNFEISATGLEGLGELKNEVVAGEMRASGETDANGLTFTGVTVTAPAGKGCKVFEDNGGVKGAEGVVRTKPLKGRTTVVKDKEEGVEEERHSVIIEPQAAGSTVLATFFVECEKGKGVPEELEGHWEITGTLTSPTHGATITANHTTITEAKGLKGKGVKAGLVGKSTVTAGKFPITETTHAISVTTTTP